MAVGRRPQFSAVWTSSWCCLGVLMAWWPAFPRVSDLRIAHAFRGLFTRGKLLSPAHT